MIDKTTTLPAWGVLPLEPCRFCGKAGGVEFLADDHPLNRDGPQVVQCTLCKRVWNVDGGIIN